MKRKPVKSSQIKSVGYNANSNTLEIEFANGGTVYQYANFSPDDFKALMAAESIGSHFHKVIKPGTTKWPYRKLDAVKPK